MSTESPGAVYSPEPNILEQKAGEYLARLHDGGAEAESHPSEIAVAEITRTSRRAVALAATAGIISGGLMGGAEVWIRQGIFDGMEDVDWQQQLPYWIGFFAFAGVISAIEIAFLYLIALRGIARITSRAGLGLGDDGYPDLFTRGLARGALEFPNPRVRIYGVDPYAYVPRWRLAVKNIAYKMKVGVSSFILRVFLRRVAARMAVRGLVPLIAGPLYAAWNAIIVWRIMLESRIRTFGPFVITAFVRSLGEGGPPRGRPAEVMLHGTGEMLRRAADAHPNHVYLLCRLREVLGTERELDVAWDRHADALGDLDPDERLQVLKVLALAALIGSRISRDQRRMLRETCGDAFDGSALKRLRRDLTHGRRIEPDDLARVCAREDGDDGARRGGGETKG